MQGIFPDGNVLVLLKKMDYSKYREFLSVQTIS